MLPGAPARAPAGAALAAIFAAALGGGSSLPWFVKGTASYGFLTGNALRIPAGERSNLVSPFQDFHLATNTSTPGISNHLGQDSTALSFGISTPQIRLAAPQRPLLASM